MATTTTTKLRKPASSISDARRIARLFGQLGCREIQYRAWGVWGGKDDLFAGGVSVALPARGHWVEYQGERHTWVTEETMPSRLFVVGWFDDIDVL